MPEQPIPPASDYDRLLERAIYLARDLEACKALLRGESVPDERIDFEQARRFQRAR